MVPSFEVRVIIESIWATEPFEILAGLAVTLPQLFEAVQDACAEARRPSILGQKLSAPKFYLQETSILPPAPTSRLYTDAKWGNDEKYLAWYKRNVRKGHSDKLRVEVHLRTSRAATDEALHNPRPTYIPLKPSERTNKNSHAWEAAPADDEEVGVISMNETVPGTDTWFPVREAELKIPASDRDLTAGSSPGHDNKSVIATARSATTTTDPPVNTTAPVKEMSTAEKNFLTGKNLEALDHSSSDDEPGRWDWLKNENTPSEQEYEDNMEWNEALGFYLPSHAYLKELTRREQVKKAEAEAKENEKRDLEVAAQAKAKK